MKLTVFTPTYNRAYVLHKLYKSLKNQSDGRFVWLIVDDGSTDNTKELVQGWIDENEIEIQYRYQPNQGKTAAHNYGVKLTETELFVCVDSDDYLAGDAVKDVIECAYGLKSEIGILAFKYDIKNNRCITQINDDTESCTLKEGYDYFGLRGDTMLVFKSDIIKKYEFPIFENEKFIPEAYLYDLLDREGKLKILRKSLYMCEYLADGYTANMSRLLFNNPQGYFAYINQRLRFDTTTKHKFADSVRYNSMAFAHKKKRIIRGAVYPVWSALAYIPGYALYCKKYRRF